MNLLPVTKAVFNKRQISSLRVLLPAVSLPPQRPVIIPYWHHAVSLTVTGIKTAHTVYAKLLFANPSINK